MEEFQLVITSDGKGQLTMRHHQVGVEESVMRVKGTIRMQVTPYGFEFSCQHAPDALDAFEGMTGDGTSGPEDALQLLKALKAAHQAGASIKIVEVPRGGGSHDGNGNGQGDKVPGQYL